MRQSVEKYPTSLDISKKYKWRLSPGNLALVKDHGVMAKVVKLQLLKGRYCTAYVLVPGE